MAKLGTSRSLFMLTCTVAAVIVAIPTGAIAAERVGEAVRISVQVSGGGGALATGDAIHRDEKIRSNASGTGAFVFADGTKLALGPNSSIVIDEYVYRSGKAGKLAIGATKGTLRWISGTSDHSAYRIDTPAGTLGVRGTAFDVYVGPDGLTAVTLLTGAAEFCNARGCQRLTRRCDVLIARPNGDISAPRGIVRDLGIGRRGDDVFPFLSGKAGLPRGFKASSSCAGLGRSVSGPGRNGPAPPRGIADPAPTPPRGGGDNPNTGGGNEPPR
ncbi:MAG: FecR domain-containing protein [Aestuariivirga sp.]